MKTCSVTCAGTTGSSMTSRVRWDPAASQVRPAIGTALHHVLHPMGRCHAPAGKAVALLLPGLLSRVNYICRLASISFAWTSSSAIRRCNRSITHCCSRTVGL